MIERVYKYPLPIGDWVSVTMPEGAVPLSVQVQGNELCLWARVEIGKPPVLHHIRIAGTGHDLGSNVGRHIDTFQIHGGRIVLHAFAEKGAT